MGKHPQIRKSDPKTPEDQGEELPQCLALRDNSRGSCWLESILYYTFVRIETDGIAKLREGMGQRRECFSNPSFPEKKTRGQDPLSRVTGYRSHPESVRTLGYPEKAARLTLKARRFPENLVCWMLSGGVMPT